MGVVVIRFGSSCYWGGIRGFSRIWDRIFADLFMGFLLFVLGVVVIVVGVCGFCFGLVVLLLSHGFFVLKRF